MEKATPEPLLKKVYYENCPGCKVDRRKDTLRGVPIKEFFYVWIVVLCNDVKKLFSGSVGGPVLIVKKSHKQVRDTHIAKREEDIGFYAGFVGAAFMFGRALTSIMWGVIADRYGRKPVIMIGTASVVLFNTLFGLSTSFWMAIFTRFLLGTMNGLLGTIKAYASEVCRAEHQALGLSLVSTAWGIGLVVGPAIGGFLAQPAEKFPDIVSEDSLFGRFPYFLPCLCISIVALVVFVACFWLPETLHMNHENGEGDNSYEALEALSDGCNLKADIQENQKIHSESKKSLFTNWPLMSAIIVYCVFSLHDMAYSEIFSLWAVSPKKFGGLSFSTDEVGVVLAITGVGLLVFQTFLYSPVEKLLGPVVVSRIAAALSVPVLSSYPFIAMLSGFGLSVLLNCASIVKNVLSIFIVTGLFVLQNNAVDQDKRGAANGIAMTGMSLFRGFGPAMGGVLFSWAQKRRDTSFLPGSHMIFFVLNVIEVIALILTFKPFLAIRTRVVNFTTMEKEGAEPLLKKVYYENCPGCKLDQRKDTYTGIPIKEFFYVWVVVLGSALPISSLFPFLYFMIRDTHIAKREDDIGFFAGFVGASFMFGRALTSYLWGVIADRYGRKPVIVIGTASVVIFNTLFGLSTSFWMAISMRFLLGTMNGLLGPIKAYASEISRPEHQALGLSLVSTAWGIGLIVGPAIGGFLAQETLHMNHGTKGGDNSYEGLEASLDGFDKKENVEKNVKCHSEPKRSLLKNWPLMSSIILYSVFSLHDMAYSEIFSLWAVSPRKLGGLSFSTADVGNILSVSGFVYTGAFKLPIHSNALRVQPFNSTKLCINFEECLLRPGPKRSRKWNFYDIDVSFQSIWPSHGRCSVFVVTKASGCFFPPRFSYDLFRPKRDRTAWTDHDF
ncbi:hypothetical protein IFM89_017313 [Coptis chinensis]|uniref:Major facilitator superfamily (MFS) profile domain-containing protein n=1 Tax=Coptis chinensis TaxID=261450 RepID=A0A835H706_9MAGN|nr:hypothetical protein IFM89_017313 [Coptis chinensis]